MKKLKQNLIISLVLVSLSSQYLMAWGKLGHEAVAQIAFKKLNPLQALKVNKLLGETALNEAAIWPDAIKHFPSKELRRKYGNTAPWHFIDIPISAKLDNLELSEGETKAQKIVEIYGKNGQNAVDQIYHFRQVLETSKDPVDRKEALMFLIHLVGDIHQPLHCADDNDRGGNNKPVKFRGRKLLGGYHTLWDHVIEKDDHGNLDDLVSECEAIDFTAPVINSSLPEDWAIESYNQAKDLVYPKYESILDVAYQDEMRPFAERRIALAGYRLANLLNDALK